MHRGGGNRKQGLRGVNPRSAVLAAVVVFEPDDVVLGKVVADLDLDQRHRPAARIGHAVDGAQRYVDGAVDLDARRLQRGHVHADGDVGDAGDDRPVLAAMGVLLQGEAGAGIDDDALDLMGGALVERLVVAPRSEMANEIAESLFRPGADRGDQILDRAGTAARGDQHRTIGGDNHDIVDADDADGVAVGADVGVPGIDDDRIAADDIAGGVPGGGVPDGGPGADVGPVEGGGDDGGNVVSGNA